MTNEELKEIEEYLVEQKKDLKKDLGDPNYGYHIDLVDTAWKLLAEIKKQDENLANLRTSIPMEWLSKFDEHFHR